MMQWIDVCAGVAAMRRAAGAVVTASIDRLDFLTPVHVGEVVVLRAQVNYVAKTSMEVGCRVETEDMRTQTRRYTTKAYLTFVALDANGRPRPLPFARARDGGRPPPAPRGRAPAARAVARRRPGPLVRRVP